MPQPADVVRFLGRGGDDVLALAREHLPVVTMFVRAYTRGNGFVDSEPLEDLAAVIVSATARLIDNPTHARQMASGPFSTTPGVFNGFTLPEIAVLHQYRRRTA